MSDNNHKEYFSLNEAMQEVGAICSKEEMIDLLKEGKIEAEGRLFDPSLTSGRHEEPLPASEHHIIKSIHWDDWEFDRAKLELINEEDQSQYVSIRIKKSELLKLNGKKDDLHKGGRPQSFDLLNFYAELAAMIYTGDLDPSPASRPLGKHERDLIILRSKELSFLDNNDALPHDKTIRNHINSFLRAFDEAQKHIDTLK